MIDLDNVTITGINFGAEGAEEVYQNLKTLYTTPVGTVPFDRSLGIDPSFLAAPLPAAQSLIVAEYIAKTLRYEPRATVYEVLFDKNQDGKLIPKVVIELDLESE